ncbi:coiled-coil domain-containing protein 134-like [Hylaeus anthracinus]|uniref:coiled-coil domain-containing protein 134-like n=1 Tax=Hylaeus anthracinus TaxID=313031 RepID=UPI0023B925C5|nr:coiled-coil domain-containing protein 134-like [Hylaeus anthracinus]
MPRVFVRIVVVSILTCASAGAGAGAGAGAAHVQHDSSSIDGQPMNEEPRINGSFETEAYEELLKKSLKHQRKDHADAVKRLEKIDNYERLYKMMMILGENMIKIIESSRTVIESASYHPERRFLPQNLTIQSAISGIVENTLFFGDVVLHFPHVMHRILKKQEKWNAIINWSLNFTNRTKHLLGEDSLGVINLMAQELGITEREPGYNNPYWKSAESRERNRGETKIKRSLKKEKEKRGPRMAKIEL